MHNSIQALIESYRKERKKHITTTWQKPINIIKRWLSPKNKIYGELWAGDMEFAHTEISKLITSLNALSPSKEEISEYIIKLKTSNTTILGRNSYIAIQAAILISLVAILSKSDFPTAFITTLISFLGIGFLLEQSTLKSEELINNEIKDILQNYKESLAQAPSN